MAASANARDSENEGNDEEFGTPKKRKAPHQTDKEPELRFDHTNHLPAHQDPKRRCRVCGGHVRLICTKCNVYLCIAKEKYCFITYHTQNDF